MGINISVQFDDTPFFSDITFIIRDVPAPPLEGKIFTCNCREFIQDKDVLGKVIETDNYSDFYLEIMWVKYGKGEITYRTGLQADGEYQQNYRERIMERSQSKKKE
jgi:hypothetical protein